MPMRPRWANDWHCKSTVQDGPINLFFWSESAQWLESYSFCQVPSAFLHPWACPCGPDGQMAIPCTSTSQDYFNELDLEWIDPVVPVLWLLQSLDLLRLWACPCGPRWAKWPYHCTFTGEEGSNELDLDWTCLVVSELWHIIPFPSERAGDKKHLRPCSMSWYSAYILNLLPYSIDVVSPLSY